MNNSTATTATTSNTNTNNITKAEPKRIKVYTMPRSFFEPLEDLSRQADYAASKLLLASKALNSTKILTKAGLEGLGTQEDPALSALKEAQTAMEYPSRVQPEEAPVKNSGKASEQAHYKGLVQPIQIMEKCLTKEELKGFLKGNIIKYSCRAGKKEGESEEKDMTKCKQYYDWLEEFERTGKISL